EIVAAKKQAEQTQRISVATADAAAIAGEATARRDREINIAQREAEMQAAKKGAEQEQRIRVAQAEAAAVTGENTARAAIAESGAKLAEIQAESRRISDVANAKSQEAILLAQRDQELARLAKEEIAPQEIEKRRVEIAADAEGEKRRREAQGEADAILSKYEAEAKGVQLVMEAKAEGYRKLIEACGTDSQVGPTLLMIEQLPKLVAEQVKAISNLKIDKITVWDTGANANGRNATSEFLAGMVNVLPKLHELAQQAGIELPASLGRINTKMPSDAASSNGHGRMET
ncbi:MAG: flotillin family protein, partial [Pyrinomonadaceae bacterium]|nr:flotillin family protein [Phycisphaerales bacterium]